MKANYRGAVKRLNAISAHLEALDFATASFFVINGLKGEELIASNSIILHELYFTWTTAARAATYGDVFMENINWENASRVHDHISRK